MDRQLRILGHPTLFALGDVTDLPEQKLAFLASAHAEVAAANIVACLRAAPNGAGADRLPARMLRSWKPSMGLPVMLVTLGRRCGRLRMMDARACKAEAAYTHSNEVCTAASQLPGGRLPAAAGTQAPWPLGAANSCSPQAPRGNHSGN